jgi:hypothetical protein
MARVTASTARLYVDGACVPQGEESKVAVIAAG